MQWTRIVLIPLMAGSLFAQPLSPAASTAATIAGKKLYITYSSPAIRGRKIMGGLVPFGQVWRTGADNATAFQTDADLDIGGLKIPKGIYTIYTVPNPTAWTLVLNKETGQWGTEYHQDRDLGRVKMTVKSLSSPVDRFKIELSATGGNQALLKMTWEKTEASVPITVK